MLYVLGEGDTGTVSGLFFKPNENDGDLGTLDSLILLSVKVNSRSNQQGHSDCLLPNRVGRAIAAGPGPLNSAAMGPRR